MSTVDEAIKTGVIDEEDLIKTEDVDDLRETLPRQTTWQRFPKRILY